MHGRGRQRLLGHLDHSNHGNLVGLESFTFCTSRDSPADLSMGGGFFSIYAASSGKSGNLFQEISVQSWRLVKLIDVLVNVKKWYDVNNRRYVSFWQRSHAGTRWLSLRSELGQIGKFIPKDLCSIREMRKAHWCARQCEEMRRG